MKILRKTPMEEQDREELLKAMDTAAGKVVNKMIFGLRDFLNEKNLSVVWKDWNGYMTKNEKKIISTLYGFK